MNTRIDANLLKENAGLAEQYNVKLAEPEIRAGISYIMSAVGDDIAGFLIDKLGNVSDTPLNEIPIDNLLQELLEDPSLRRMYDDNNESDKSDQSFSRFKTVIPNADQKKTSIQKLWRVTVEVLISYLQVIHQYHDSFDPLRKKLITIINTLLRDVKLSNPYPDNKPATKKLIDTQNNAVIIKILSSLEAIEYLDLTYLKTCLHHNQELSDDIYLIYQYLNMPKCLQVAPYTAYEDTLSVFKTFLKKQITNLQPKISEEERVRNAYTLSAAVSTASASTSTPEPVREATKTSSEHKPFSNKEETLLFLKQMIKKSLAKAAQADDHLPTMLSPMDWEPQKEKTITNLLPQLAPRLDHFDGARLIAAVKGKSNEDFESQLNKAIRLKQDLTSIVDEDYEGNILHWAAVNGDLVKTRLIIEKTGEVLVNTRSRNQSTPLHNAAVGGHLEAYHLLQQHHANPFLTNNEKKTAYQLMQEWGEQSAHTETPAALTLAETSITAAAPVVDRATTLQLINRLIEAIRYFNLRNIESLVKTITSFGISLDTLGPDNYTPLTFAASMANTKVIEILVAAGAALKAYDGHGYLAIHHAASSANSDSIETRKAGYNTLCYLKNLDTDLLTAKNSNGRGTPTINLLKTIDQLINAIRYFNPRNTDNIEFLVKMAKAIGISLDTPGADRYTPLTFAANCNNVAVVEILLKNGVNPLKADGFRKDALSYALSARDNNRLIDLLSKGDAYYQVMGLAVPQLITSASTSLPMKPPVITTAATAPTPQRSAFGIGSATLYSQQPNNSEQLFEKELLAAIRAGNIEVVHDLTFSRNHFNIDKMIQGRSLLSHAIRMPKYTSNGIVIIRFLLAFSANPTLKDEVDGKDPFIHLCDSRDIPESLIQQLWAEMEQRKPAARAAA